MSNIWQDYIGKNILGKGTAGDNKADNSYPDLVRLKMLKRKTDKFLRHCMATDAYDSLRVLSLLAMSAQLDASIEILETLLEIASDVDALTFKS